MISSFLILQISLSCTHQLIQTTSPSRRLQATFTRTYGSPKRPCIHIFYFLRFPEITGSFSRDLVMTKLCFPEITHLRTHNKSCTLYQQVLSESFHHVQQKSCRHTSNTHTHDSQRDAFKIKVPHLVSNIVNQIITWL